MSILDYRGFRLMALSVLPIDHSTLKYGSDNMGVTVLASEPEINEKMQVWVFSRFTVGF